MISVAQEFNEDGTLLNGMFLSEFHDLFNLENVISLSSDTWDLITSLEEIGVH